MRKDNEHLVSLNPEYGIEVSALTQLAESIKNDNKELFNILTILIASMLGNDEKKFLEYCNRYLEDKAYEDIIKDQINGMLKDYKDQFPNDDIDDFWKI